MKPNLERGMTITPMKLTVTRAEIMEILNEKYGLHLPDSCRVEVYDNGRSIGPFSDIVLKWNETSTNGLTPECKAILEGIVGPLDS